MHEITGNGDKRISNQGLGSTERTHTYGRSLADVTVDCLILQTPSTRYLSYTRKHTGWGQSSDEIQNGTMSCVNYLSFIP